MNDFRIYTAGLVCDIAPDGTSRGVCFKDEAVEFRGVATPIQSIAVTGAPSGTQPVVSGATVTPHELGLVTLAITYTTGAVVSARIFACDRTALDGIPDPSSSKTFAEKCSILRGLA